MGEQPTLQFRDYGYALINTMGVLTLNMSFACHGSPPTTQEWNAIVRFLIEHQVASLSLDSCELTVLPESLVRATALRTLYLRFNHFAIRPEVLQRMPTLAHVELFGNPCYRQTPLTVLQ